MSRCLNFLDAVLSSGSGARLEAYVMSILQLCPHAVRSFEFAGLDAGLDLKRSYDVDTPFMERFLSLSQEEPLDRELLLFDVKSSIAVEGGRQECRASRLQKAAAAFFICVFAADMYWVDVVPNYDQDIEVLESGVLGNADDMSEHIVINETRKSLMAPRQYVLDPASIPHRMPWWMLPEAIRRIRRTATHGEVFINPWTEVDFPKWMPKSTRHFRLMEPSEESMQFSAYEHVMHTIRSLKYESSLLVDFVWMAPRLADFKINGKLVQHKADTEPRSLKMQEPFLYVAVSRDQKGERHYFNVLERFDFFMYQFEFNSNPRRRVFFFIPECELPDWLYQSIKKRVSFEGFRKFLVEMDNQFQWVKRIEDIIKEYPEPRKTGERPAKDLSTLSSAGNQTQAAQQELVQQGSAVLPIAIREDRRKYLQSQRRSFRSFYTRIMNECAKRRQGVLLIQSRNNGACDFAFCRWYRWTDKEELEWRQLGRPPVFSHSMPATTLCVPVLYFARHQECSFDGPSITARQYSRLNFGQIRRLLVVDIAGPDAPLGSFSPAIIPSEDVAPTQNQRTVLLGNLGKQKSQGEWDHKTPSISGLLNTGHYAVEYAVGTRGPVHLAAGSDISKVWQLLDAFASPLALQHPRGVQRDTSKYQYTLRTINRQLERQYEVRRQDPTQVDFEEDEAGDASEDELDLH